MVLAQNLEEFLAHPGTLIDVRSPSEFAHAHIPGAYSLPLFTDEERAHVGTLYHKQGQTTAIDAGLVIVGPKLPRFASQIRAITQKEAKVYCWRGGMRSQSMASLINFLQINAITLPGGYKTYRQKSYQLEILLDTKTFDWQVLSGFTGSGKTELLHKKQSEGETILDLEHLANHRGSAFGSIGLGPQPSQEMFENLLYHKLYSLPPKTTIWTENESRLIGKLIIPAPLYTQIHSAPKHLVTCSQEERIDRIKKEYQTGTKEELIEALQKIRKKLGGERTQKILTAIEKGEIDQIIPPLLDYYDHLYKD